MQLLRLLSRVAFICNICFLQSAGGRTNLAGDRLRLPAVHFCERGRQPVGTRFVGDAEVKGIGGTGLAARRQFCVFFTPATFTNY
jgi:hypothetical protein